MTTDGVATVGVVGVGAMGRPLITRLQAAGFTVGAYARREEVRAELTATGVDCATSAAALAAGSNVVIVYVYTDDQVRSVVLDDGLGAALQPGSCLLVGTTCSPNTLAEIDAALSPRGVRVVDAPASGGPAQLAAGELVVFLGGDEDAIERSRPVLTSYTRRATRFGPLGAGQRVKLLNNLLFTAHIEVMLEGARLCEQFGLPVADVAAELHDCSGASHALGLLASLGSATEVARLAGPFVAKDARVAMQIAADLGTGIGEPLRSVIGSLLERLDNTRA